MNSLLIILLMTAAGVEWMGAADFGISTNINTN